MREIKRNMSEHEKTIRRAMIDKDIGVNELAKRCGISPSYCHDLIIGSRFGSVKVRTALNEVLGLELPCKPTYYHDDHNLY